LAQLKFGLRIPSVAVMNTDDLRGFVLEAESLGFDSIWAGDHVFYRVDVLQPLQLLSWVAALTTRVGLGTAVMLTSYLNPVLLAKAAASLDYLSSGRLILGLSIGGTEAEYTSIGVPMKERVGRLVESVKIMRRLWSADGVNFVGKYNKVVDGTINPKPVQRPGVPLYFGATSDPMLVRLAGVADGWIGSAASGLEPFLTGVDKVKAAATAKGRSSESLGFAKLQSVSVHADPKEAFALAERHWKRYYGPNFDVERNVVSGAPKEVGERLAGYARANCSELTLVLEPSDLSAGQLALLLRAGDYAADKSR
jgi:probable F420-dependent oxidoreductase